MAVLLLRLFASKHQLNHEGAERIEEVLLRHILLPITSHILAWRLSWGSLGKTARCGTVQACIPTLYSFDTNCSHIVTKECRLLARSMLYSGESKDFWGLILIQILVWSQAGGFTGKSQSLSSQFRFLPPPPHLVPPSPPPSWLLLPLPLLPELNDTWKNLVPWMLGYMKVFCDWLPLSFPSAKTEKHSFSIFLELMYPLFFLLKLQGAVLTHAHPLWHCWWHLQIRSL